MIRVTLMGRISRSMVVSLLLIPLCRVDWRSYLCYFLDSEKFIVHARPWFNINVQLSKFPDSVP